MADFFKPAPQPATPLGQHRILSRTAGIHVSPLALGGMSLGDNWTSFMGAMDRKSAFALLDTFVAAGGNFIDTANGYQHGQSEAWIGEWMRERGNRDQVVLATKYSFQYRAPTGAHKTPANNNFWGNHRRSLVMSLRDSLTNLNVDFVDILYVHWWDYTTSIEEVMDALHILIEQGKVLYLGISDAPAWIVATANTYARAHGKTVFSVYQGRWNVLQRDLEREILPMAMHFGMSIVPWNVLATGKFMSPKQAAARKAQGDAGRFGSGQSDAEVRMSEALWAVAQNKGVDSVQAIALAYVRSKAPGLTVLPVVGGRRVEHLQANIEALNVELSQDEIETLEKASAFDIGFPADFIGQDWHLTGVPGERMAAQGPLVV